MSYDPARLVLLLGSYKALTFGFLSENCGVSSSDSSLVSRESPGTDGGLEPAPTILEIIQVLPYHIYKKS